MDWWLPWGPSRVGTCCPWKARCKPSSATNRQQGALALFPWRARCKPSSSTKKPQWPKAAPGAAPRVRALLGFLPAMLAAPAAPAPFSACQRTASSGTGGSPWTQRVRPPLSPAPHSALAGAASGLGEEQSEAPGNEQVRRATKESAEAQQVSPRVPPLGTDPRGAPGTAPAGLVEVVELQLKVSPLPCPTQGQPAPLPNSRSARSLAQLKVSPPVRSLAQLKVSPPVRSLAQLRSAPRALPCPTQGQPAPLPNSRSAPPCAPLPNPCACCSPRGSLEGATSGMEKVLSAAPHCLQHAESCSALPSAQHAEFHRALPSAQHAESHRAPPLALRLQMELQGLFQTLSSRVTTLAVVSNSHPGALDRNVGHTP